MGKNSKQSVLIAYLFIGLGVFFLIREWDLPFIHYLYSWQSIVMLVGVFLLLYGYKTKNYQHLFPGVLLLGLGIHFHGLAYYDFWIDHWGMYPFIVGVAFLVRSIKTKDGRMVGALLAIFSLLMIFSDFFSYYFSWFQSLTEMFNQIWPIILILVGIYILKKK